MFICFVFFILDAARWQGPCLFIANLYARHTVNNNKYLLNE